MCCLTHAERDRRDKRAGVPFALAEREDFRCRCQYGNPCHRRATDEDFLCDWCRGRNHDLACQELGVAYGEPAGMRAPDRPVDKYPELYTLSEDGRYITRYIRKPLDGPPPAPLPYIRPMREETTMATRIAQILAVVGGVKNDVTAQLSNLEHNVTTPDLISGLSKTYRPLAEPVPGEPAPLQRPPQYKKVQVTVDEVLDGVARLLTRQLDVTRTLDEAKTRAAADVVIDGSVLLAQVNSDHLIFLEGRLAELLTFVSKLPVLDPGDDWTDEGTEPGQHRTRPVETTSNDTVYFNHVLVKPEVIDDHLVEPQVQIMKREEPVGIWTTVKFSGAIDPRRKRELLDRIGKLRDAVRFAREEANMSEVVDVYEGAAIFRYLYGALG